MGIALIILLLYSMIGELQSATEVDGVLGQALSY